MKTLPPWAQRLVTATYRDIQFLTENHDFKGGRRLAIHEFPGAEQPVVEDLGGKADEFHLNAYFIGADYDLLRDKFLLALNTPGAEWLIHPWRGRVWVRAHNWSVHESNDKGGYCQVGVDFAPGGMVQTALVDRTDLALAKIEGFKKTADAVPPPLTDSALTSLVKVVNAQLTTLRNLISMATLPLTYLNQVRDVIDGIKGEAASLLALPAQYAAAFTSLANLLGNSADDNGLADTARPALVNTLVTMASIPLVLPGGAGDSPALRLNAQWVADANSRLLLASAAQVALADYRVAGDRDAALASVVSAIDAMLPRMSDTVFQAAWDCRATLIEALMAQNLEPAVSRDIVYPLPSTVLAHRLEVSEEVFMAVNQVRHPLFVRGRIHG